MSEVARLVLRHPRGASAIRVGAGALAETASELAPWLAGRTVFIISTPRVVGLHGEALEPLLAAAGRSLLLTVPEGEAAKTLDEAQRLWRQLLAGGGKRDSRLLAFGGGSVGDLAGFVAGCFLRGIEYAQLPTTLLAQVDAAIGGKTAVDLHEGKNFVGLFHHPNWVVADTSLLVTLPESELRSGLIEVAKMAALLDLGLLSAMEEGIDDLLAGKPEVLAPVVARAAAAKIAVVERDPEERGERRLLNFGHTLGHALEAALGFEALRHGEAVGYGLLFALRLAERRGLDRAFAARLRALLARLQLPPLPELAPEAVLAPLALDKKRQEEGQAWVLPAAPGLGRVVTDVSGEELRQELVDFLAAPWQPSTAGPDL